MKKKTVLSVGLTLVFACILSVGGYFGFDYWQGMRFSADAQKNTLSVSIAANKQSAEVGETVNYSVKFTSNYTKNTRVYADFLLANGKDFEKKSMAVSFSPGETIEYTIPVKIIGAATGDTTKSTINVYSSKANMLNRRVSKPVLTASTNVKFAEAGKGVTMSINYVGNTKSSSKEDPLAENTTWISNGVIEKGKASNIDAHDLIEADLVFKNNSNDSVTIECPFKVNLDGPGYGTTGFLPSVNKCGGNDTSIELLPGKSLTRRIQILFADVRDYVSKEDGTSKLVWTKSDLQLAITDPNDTFWMLEDIKTGTYNLSVSSSVRIGSATSYTTNTLSTEPAKINYTQADPGDDKLITTKTVAPNWSAKLTMTDMFKASGSDDFLAEKTTRNIGDVNVWTNADKSIRADFNDAIKGTLVIKNNSSAEQTLNYLYGCEYPSVTFGNEKVERGTPGSCALGVSALVPVKVAANKSFEIPVIVALSNKQAYSLSPIKGTFSYLSYNPLTAFWVNPSKDATYALTAEFGGVKSNVVNIQYTKADKE